MIRDSSESAKYRAFLIGLMMIGFGLVDPKVAIIPFIFGFSIVLFATYEKYMGVVRRFYDGR